MGLVDYSDSDASDVEEAPVTKPSGNPTKPAFQKVVDRSNPGKIRVTLPGTTSTVQTNGDEPPTKRAKTSGGGLGGFNSFLPAPKRTGVSASSGLGGENATGRSGMSAGVGLKTGAAPGFSREPAEDVYESKPEATEPQAQSSGGLSLPPPKGAVESTPIPAEEVKLVGKPMMFKPLSVSRNPKKKKPVGGITPHKQSTATQAQVSATSAAATPAQASPRPKVSLFSVSSEPEESYTASSNGDYKPMIYGATDKANGDEPQEDLSNYQYDEQPETRSNSMPISAPIGGQSLDDIASDMGLSAADRRQLFGRQKGGRGVPTAQKVINFNTDQEYRHNEELRAAGEQVQHNPVRSIAPGKHNLKQLVNAAASQKEALEESFAKGKSNRAEASSRYGW